MLDIDRLQFDMLNFVLSHAVDSSKVKRMGSGNTITPLGSSPIASPVSANDEWSFQSVADIPKITQDDVTQLPRQEELKSSKGCI